jgi:hypothetical protein
MNIIRRLKGYDRLSFKPWGSDLIMAIYSVYEKGRKGETLQIRKMGELREIIIRDPSWKIIYDVHSEQNKEKPV